MQDRYPPAFDYMVPLVHPYIMGDSFDPRANQPIWRTNRRHFSYGADAPAYTPTGMDKIDAVCASVVGQSMPTTFTTPQELMLGTQILLCKLSAATQENPEVDYNVLINTRLVKVDTLTSLISGQYTLEDEISFVNEVVNLVTKEKKSYKKEVKSAWIAWQKGTEAYLTELTAEGEASGDVSKEELEKLKKNKDRTKEWYQDWKYFVPLGVVTVLIGLQLKKRFS